MSFPMLQVEGVGLMPVGDRHDPKDVQTAKWFLGLRLSSRTIEAHLNGRMDHATICRLRKSMRQNVAQQIVAQPQDLQRNVENELASYSPAPLSSFNHGLGSKTPESVIKRIVRENCSLRSPFESKVKEWELSPWISGKDQDPELGKHLQTLKDILMRLGFSPESDNDSQFKVLNELGWIVRKVHKKAKEQELKLDSRKLVEATIIYHLGEVYRQRLETIEKKLVCSRCRKPRSYVLEKDGMNYLCVRCGKQIPIGKARFKVRVRLIDERYLSLIHEALREVSNKVAVQ